MSVEQPSSLSSESRGTVSIGYDATTQCNITPHRYYIQNTLTIWVYQRFSERDTAWVRHETATLMDNVAEIRSRAESAFLIS
jgi:hypothetical protein